MSARPGGGLGGPRRDRLAYLAMLRRSSRYNAQAARLRFAALLVVAGCALPSQHRWLALLHCLPATLAAYLGVVGARYLRSDRLSPSLLIAVHQRNVRRTEGRQVLALNTYPEILGGGLLVAVPTWVTTDLPSWCRVVMLGAGTVHLTSTVVAIFTDHAWYNPEEHPGRWQEVCRLLAGPMTSGVLCAVVLPARWDADARTATLVIVAAPLLVVALRVRNTDLMVSDVTALVREEAHTGRELVINETHGALSTHLRLLEQEAREVRRDAPRLHDLAVSANARLRETLTLARIGQDSSTNPSALAAPVYTLARAVGARASVDIAVPGLGHDDRELARLVLNDLVGNAVNAGAGVITASLTCEDGQLVVRVRDDGPPMPTGVWRSPGTSSARLGDRLERLSGSLDHREDAEGKTVEARWPPQVLLDGDGRGR